MQMGWLGSRAQVESGKIKGSREKKVTGVGHGDLAVLAGSLEGDIK